MLFQHFKKLVAYITQQLTVSAINSKKMSINFTMQVKIKNSFKQMKINLKNYNLSIKKIMK